LPDGAIGPGAADVVFQAGDGSSEVFTTSGTLDDWRTEVAGKAVGNINLTLAIATAFAGPMLGPCNTESGGIHFVGSSSSGKTTSVIAACSVWGGASYRRSWRATANGMEGAAVLSNDVLLALDEISEADPSQVGAIVYTLGNGRGKQRATRSGLARDVAQWRCVVLSSGERTLGTTMAEARQQIKAGQSVRLVDLPADRRHGAWDELHGAASGSAFSDLLQRAAMAHHGYAGRAFLERLTNDKRNFCDLLDRFKALPEFTLEGGEGQEKRVAGRFALFALAGELATEYGITGWTEGWATEAAIEGFRTWQANRGTGNVERRQVLDSLARFIERHGDARFSDADQDNEAPVRDRAGWWRDDGLRGRIYLLNASGMREALIGFDFKRSLDVLEAEGCISQADASGERARPERLGGRLVRVYRVFSDKLTTNHHAS
jgi:putative DNA primase/helicase